MEVATELLQILPVETVQEAEFLLFHPSRRRKERGLRSFAADWSAALAEGLEVLAECQKEVVGPSPGELDLAPQLELAEASCLFFFCAKNLAMSRLYDDGCFQRCHLYGDGCFQNYRLCACGKFCCACACVSLSKGTELPALVLSVTYQDSVLSQESAVVAQEQGEQERE